MNHHVSNSLEQVWIMRRSWQEIDLAKSLSDFLKFMFAFDKSLPWKTKSKKSFLKETKVIFLMKTSLERLL